MKAHPFVDSCRTHVGIQVRQKASSEPQSIAYLADAHSQSPDVVFNQDHELIE